jgi:hypothetical protein
MFKKTVPYPPYSSGLAITNFHWSDVLKQNPQGIDVSDDEKLKIEILTIFR